MKRTNKDLLDFFQMQKSGEKTELLAKYIAEAERQIGFENIVPDDEIRLLWEKNKELPGTLQDFAFVLYEQIITGVCNIIATT